ncbi:MAG: hypothetical protein QHI48_03015 [Bacteroidota bacterium]|nr:hypothetical protein [Bacteroidota bacterium]
MIYRSFLPALFGFVFLACNDTSTVVDVNFPEPPPAFISLTLSSYTFDTDSMSIVPGRNKTPADPVMIRIGIEATADLDARQEARIVRASCTVTPDGKEQVIAQSDLARQTETVFTGTVPLSIARGDVGVYRVTVAGEDAMGRQSASIHTTFRVIAGAKAPFFCGLTAPDTVDLPLEGFDIIRLALCVDDSSGRADIKRVLFNSFLPSGKPSSGNPFPMYDDGTHGDITAGDGTYSLDVQLPATAERGRYRFEFFAYDLGNLSAFLSHTIVVR